MYRTLFLHEIIDDCCCCFCFVLNDKCFYLPNIWNVKFGNEFSKWKEKISVLGINIVRLGVFIAFKSMLNFCFIKNYWLLTFKLVASICISTWSILTTDVWHKELLHIREVWFSINHQNLKRKKLLAFWQPLLLQLCRSSSNFLFLRNNYARSSPSLLSLENNIIN